MKSVTILGSWKPENAKEVEQEAAELGKLLAKRGFELVSGGGWGVAGTVAAQYLAHGGKRYTCYRPTKAWEQKIGEPLGPKPHKLIRTKEDYPGRNVIMIRNSESVIALHGGLGTLTEVIMAIKDYHLPVAVVHFGKFAEYVNAIGELKEKLFIAKTVKVAVDHVTA